MKIVVKESTIVRPMEVTHRVNVWNSNLDLVVAPIHVPIVCIYRPDGASNFFDVKVIKHALSRILVAFYPVSGRLKIGEDGRVNINCEGQGVLFVEAESDSVLDDLGDFAPTSNLQKLIPAVDYSQGIESYPLLVSQLTYFKCGGVSLGVGTHHFVADGKSWAHFVNSWSEMARGLELSLQPFIDRTLLRARDPPQPVFEHVEYKPTPIMKSAVESQVPNEPLVSIFKLSQEQLNVLKVKSKEDGNAINFTTFELISGHLWKCMSRARGLANDQETKLYIATDYRAHLQQSIPPGYFGNVISLTVAVATAGEIKSTPSRYTASKVHNVLEKVSTNYLMSTIDHLELQQDLYTLGGDILETYKYSDLAITSLTSFSDHDANFGWGRPVFIGPGGIGLEGVAFVLPRPIDDKSSSMVVSLQPEHMKLFSKFFYKMFTMNSSLPSKL